MNKVDEFINDLEELTNLMSSFSTKWTGIEDEEFQKGTPKQQAKLLSIMKRFERVCETLLQKQ